MGGTFSAPRNTVMPMFAPAHAANLNDFFAEQHEDLRKYNAALQTLTAKLDADADVGTTTYAADDYTLTVTGVEKFEIRNDVMPRIAMDVDFLTGDAILTDLTGVKAAIAAMTAKLDADAGVTATDYNAEDMGALTVVALTPTEIEARNPVAGMLSAGSVAELHTHSALVVADLAAARASIVAITAKLDADGAITATDWASSVDPAAATITALTA